MTIEPWSAARVEELKELNVTIKHRVYSQAQSEEYAAWVASHNIPDYVYHNDSYAQWVKNDIRETKLIRKQAESMGLFCEVIAY